MIDAVVFGNALKRYVAHLARAHLQRVGGVFKGVGKVEGVDLQQEFAPVGLYRDEDWTHCAGKK